MNRWIRVLWWAGLPVRIILIAVLSLGFLISPNSLREIGDIIKDIWRGKA